jgi:tetratricopeptide (TPR) repeat protein
MRKLAVVGAVMSALMLSGCSGLGEDQDNGWDMIAAQDFSSARAHYQSMLAENPNDPYANLNLGVAYEELGDKQLAAKHYQVAIANGKDAEIQEVAQDGKTAARSTTVAKIAQENLAGLGG